MHDLKRTAVAVLALALLCPAFTAAQSGTIEEIAVQGLFRMTREAFMHALRIEVGDPYDEDVIRARFKALWRLGLFEDILFESERREGGGRVLIIKVKERPVLTSVTYEDNSVLTRTAIEDRLKERKVALQLGKPIDMGAVFFTETAIRDLLSEKGFLNSEVESDVRKVTETTRAVHFLITPGGKTRIRRIDFIGNELFPDRKLKAQLKLTEERRWFWPWSRKNLYHPVKWDQDAGGVRDLYLNRGYLDAEVRPPIVEVRESGKAGTAAKSGKSGKAGSSDNVDGPAATADGALAEPAAAPAAPPDDLTPKQLKKWQRQERKRQQKAREQAKKAKKVKRWVYLVVPVVEGPQYTLGQITINGNEVFQENALRALIPLREGQTLYNNFLQAGVDRISRLYEDRGHLYSNVVRRLHRREGENVADVEISVDEDKPYYIARIDFSGNTATRDKVLRREMLLSEGDLFSRTALDFSRTKVNQLGYWQVQQDPIIEPIEGENRVNITFTGDEQGRNEIQVGGGYSGLDGAFFNGVYSTRNFLGRGQVLSTALQIGGRSDRYQFSFQEPWFLNRPYRLGVSLFRTDVDFGSSLRSTSTGGGLLLGKRLTRFSSLDLGYNWQRVSSRTVLNPRGATDITSITTETRVSSLTPVFNYSTINNPFRPSRGKQFRSSLQIAGGPLGGETGFLKPILSFTGYRRALGSSFVALHAQGGLVREWQNDNPVNGSNIEGIPRFERFWLGGDTLGPRVFETRSITPLRFVELRGVDEDGDGDIDRQVISDVLGDPRFVSADDLVTSGGIPVLIEAGGDRFYLFQTEYVFPLNEQVEVAAFFDVGNALFEDQSLGFDTARVSAGVEVRFHLPIFPVPLRLIYGIPVRKLEGDQTSNFTFSIGRSF